MVWWWLSFCTIPFLFVREVRYDRFRLGWMGEKRGGGVVGGGGDVRDTSDNVEHEQSNGLGEVDVEFGVGVVGVQCLWGCVGM